MAQAAPAEQPLGVIARYALAGPIDGYEAIGVASIVIALLCQAVAPNLIGIAGLIYCAVGIVEWRIGEYHGRQRKLLTGE